MSTPRSTATILLTLPLLVLAACQPGAEEVEPGDEAAQVQPTETAAPVQIDTTAEAVFAHLESEGYQDEWTLWPELEPYYGGTQPHGRLLTTYVNEPAARGVAAMRGGTADDLPFGSVVVKENYMPDSTLAAVTVMYKREAYDPDHNDWFWVKRLADGTVEASGRVESCIECHAQAADDFDYLVTAQSQLGG